MAFIDRAVPEKEVWQGKDPPMVVVQRGAELQGQHIPVRTAEAAKAWTPAQVGPSPVSCSFYE